MNENQQERNEDLRIDAEHPIQASDVGRKYTDANGEHVYTADDIHVGIGAKIVSGFRWLSRAECKARGLDAQHPTQRWDEPARKPGEFKVGDRVRLKLDRAHDEYGPGVVVTHDEWYEARGWRLDEESLPIRHDVVVGGYRHFWSRAAFLILIEPAREGEDASTRKGDGASPVMQGESSQASSPPVARRVSPAELWTPDELGRYARAMWAGNRASQPMQSPPAPSADSVQADALGMKNATPPRRPLTREERYQLALCVLCGWQEVR